MLSALRKMETGRLMRIVMCAFSAAFLVGAFAAPDPGSALRGLARICTAPAQLTRDYFLPDYGGVSGTLLNAALVGAVCCALMFLPRASVDAGTVLGFFLTLGFCFYGINVLNILPLMLGVWVYALAKRRAPGELLNQFMFSTAIAPLITQVLFYYPVMGDGPRLTFAGICLAVGIGMITGFCMPALCAHSRLFHKGFDLYNAGPAAGFLCALIYAALYRARGIEAPAISAVLGEGEDAFANAFCAGLFLLCLAFGAILNGGTRGFGQLMGDAGYETDFTRKYGAGLCLMNLGVYGLFILLYYNLIGAAFTGPTTGAVFCMVCCCLSGATPLNVLPVMAGYGIMGLLNRLGVTAYPLDAQAIIVGLCFASGLAPIRGRFGFAAGILAGICHYCLVTAVPAIHGGFNLYNGGFTAGIVCFILVPVLERLAKDCHGSQDPPGNRAPGSADAQAAERRSTGPR